MNQQMKDDIQFLKDFQHELNTQDTQHQASPRYWGIMNYRDVPGNEDYDNGGTSYFHNDGDHSEFNNFEDLKDFLEEHYEDVVELDQELQGILNGSDQDFFELWEYVVDNHNEDGYYSEVFMREDSFVVPGTMFLTKAEAQKHLELNHYHYSPKAHTYAMTAWRAPKVERLMNILMNFDFEALEKVEDDRSFFLGAYVEKVMKK